MSLPPEQDSDSIGEALDRAFDHLGVYWTGGWPPRRSHSRLWLRWAVSSAAACAAGIAALFIPWLAPLHRQQVTVTVPVASNPALPHNVRKLLQTFAARHMVVQSMAPVYASYPVVSPSAHSVNLSGNYTIAGVSGTELSLVVGQNYQPQNGVLFAGNRPVLSFRVGLNDGLAAVQRIQPAGAPKPLAGKWWVGGTSQLNSFTAAGPLVYASHRGYWTVITGLAPARWNPPPTGPGAVETATIAGLPAMATHALLVEEGSSGVSQGFVSDNQGRSWKSWAIGHVTFSHLVAMYHQYWATVNGSLRESTNGSTWTTILGVNHARWKVQDFAVNPQDPNMLVASLVPVAGSGIGPVLVTANGGQSWSQIPNFPNLGVAPNDLAVLSNGDIAALVPLAKPVLVEYHQMGQSWQIIPVPRQAMGLGTGQLTAAPNGNLVYAAPGGDIYLWSGGPHAWHVIVPPVEAPLNSNSASPLEAIGNNQIMAGYQSGWYYFSFPPSALKS